MTATTAGLMFWDDTVLLNYNLLKTFTAAGTYKGIISNTDADSMVRIGFVIDSNNGDIKPDYLRISPATETGWQHDGSTTSGVTLTASASVSSDGDLINITASASGQKLDFASDKTATQARIEVDYYPFLEWKIDAVGDSGSSGVYAIRVRGDSGTAYASLWSSVTGTYRWNIGASGVGDVYDIEVYIKDASDWVQFDYIAAYSIANFTVTQSSTTTDDYLYVDSGTLYSHVDSGYIEANHDPALDIGPHYEWNMNTSLGTPEVDFYDGSWLGYSTETEGEFSIGTTVTDFRLKFTDNANIISLTFTDVTKWQDAGTVIIYFEVPIFEGSLNALLIFLGLIMIPASTLYFVKGGKEEMSGNKVYYCLIVFTVGWALFLGGIYG
jgi:hypothetical protein